MTKKNCLIVDDSRMSRMMIHKFISASHPDWRIEEAENGDQALKKSSEQTFQVITLDFNMPGMNGLEVAEKLRPLFPNARIALLTANIQDSIKNKALQLGIEFIPKPISEQKIKSYVC